MLYHILKTGFKSCKDGRICRELTFWSLYLWHRTGAHAQFVNILMFNLDWAALVCTNHFSVLNWLIAWPDSLLLLSFMITITVDSGPFVNFRCGYRPGTDFLWYRALKDLSKCFSMTYKDCWWIVGALQLYCSQKPGGLICTLYKKSEHSFVFYVSQLNNVKLI